MGTMTVENTYKRFIDVDDMQELILDNISSKETDQYFSHMVFRENDLKTAFVQGMIYASILSAVKCKKYTVEKND